MKHCVGHHLANVNARSGHHIQSECPHQALSKAKLNKNKKIIESIKWVHLYKCQEENIINTLVSSMWARLLCVRISNMPSRWKYRAFEMDPRQFQCDFEVDPRQIRDSFKVDSRSIRDDSKEDLRLLQGGSDMLSSQSITSIKTEVGRGFPTKSLRRTSNLRSLNVDLSNSKRVSPFSIFLFRIYFYTLKKRRKFVISFIVIEEKKRVQDYLLYRGEK